MGQMRSACGRLLAMSQVGAVRRAALKRPGLTPRGGACGSPSPPPAILHVLLKEVMFRAD